MSRIIRGEELDRLAPVIEKARQEALISRCRKDHRGAVVFRGEEILGSGNNGPLPPLGCRLDKCVDVCGLYAVHAERVALIIAMDRRANLHGASVLHVRIDDAGEVQESGPLRCDDCSGFMRRFLRKGIDLKEFVLLQEGGWTAYGIEEADMITRRNLGLT